MGITTKSRRSRRNATPQELQKEYVKSQKFTSTAEIMDEMKEMFREVIQTVMEVELDEDAMLQIAESVILNDE